jgi:SpoIID/LytB domain protein
MPDGRRLVGLSIAGLLLATLATAMSGTGTVVARADTAAESIVPATDVAPEQHVVGDVRFVTADGDTLQLADGPRYRGAIDLRVRDGVVVNDVGIDDYVAGIAEMPSRWPVEALKAQAVAARTYAWWVRERDTYDGYDICASTACQVYRGADVVLDGGERWAEAVASTAGEVLLDDTGAPVLARYFSTSGGATYANEEVFPSTGALDHLVAIDDPDDAVSPYHRWTVRFDREEFDVLLARGDTLRAAVPVADVQRQGPVARHDAQLRVTGRDGTEVTVDALALRDFLNRFAPELDAGRYPPRRADGIARLPTTVPSTRFAVDVRADEVVIEGQGWGHGVGLGQYGARGRAARGESYDAILASYYNGLEPQTPGDLPARIRVGLDRPVVAVGEGLVVRCDGPVRIEGAGGEVVVDRAFGAWTATRGDDGWTLQPPPGHDAELQVAPTRRTEAFGTRFAIEVEVNKPALLELEVRDPAGTAVLRRTIGAVDAGTHAASWDGSGADGSAVADGTYGVALVAEDAAGRRAGTPVAIVVDQGRTGTPAASDLSDSRPVRTPVLLALGAAGLVAAASLLLLIRKERS